MLNIIVNTGYNNIIGINNDLFIKCKEDLNYFKKITSETYTDKKNIVVMGYNTWCSIPEKNKPLQNRLNVIISRNHMSTINVNENVKSFVTLDNFIEWLIFNKKKYNKVFIIGGESIYNQVFTNYSSSIEAVYITKVNSTNLNIDDIIKNNNNLHISYFNNDIWNNENYDLYLSKSKSTNGLIYDKGNYEKCELDLSFQIYLNKVNKNKEELNYLNLMDRILNKDNIKDTRNSKVYSTFGEKMVFDLRETFPLLTTKKMPFKTILRELLWFIKGSTNNEELKKSKVNIWNKNADDYFKSSNYENGDLGPVYGFQWRHFGAKYDGCDKKYDNQGIDQLKYIINEIKSNPSSRRLVLSSWNPVDIPNMALPPCHVMVQFNISGKYIDAQLYQRSGDMFLGVPFNIASYSLLLHIIGKITGYIPRKFIHIIGDTHIYENHINAVKEQINRIPYKFPELIISEELNDIDNITENMFEIKNYNYYPTIKAEMIV